MLHDANNNNNDAKKTRNSKNLLTNELPKVNVSKTKEKEKGGGCLFSTIAKKFLNL